MNLETYYKNVIIRKPDTKPIVNLSPIGLGKNENAKSTFLSFNKRLLIQRNKFELKSFIRKFQKCCTKIVYYYQEKLDN